MTIWRKIMYWFNPPPPPVSDEELGAIGRVATSVALRADAAAKAKKKAKKAVKKPLPKPIRKPKSPPKPHPKKPKAPIVVEEIKVDGMVKVKKPRKSKTSVDTPVESVNVEIKDADK